MFNALFSAYSPSLFQQTGSSDFIRTTYRLNLRSSRQLSTAAAVPTLRCTRCETEHGCAYLARHLFAHGTLRHYALHAGRLRDVAPNDFALGSFHVLGRDTILLSLARQDQEGRTEEGRGTWSPA